MFNGLHAIYLIVNVIFVLGIIFYFIEDSYFEDMHYRASRRAREILNRKKDGIALKGHDTPIRRQFQRSDMHGRTFLLMFVAMIGFSVLSFALFLGLASSQIEKFHATSENFVRVAIPYEDFPHDYSTKSMSLYIEDWGLDYSLDSIEDYEGELEDIEAVSEFFADNDTLDKADGTINNDRLNAVFLSTKLHRAGTEVDPGFLFSTEGDPGVYLVEHIGKEDMIFYSEGDRHWSVVFVLDPEDRNGVYYADLDEWTRGPLTPDQEVRR